MVYNNLSAAPSPTLPHPLPVSFFLGVDSVSSPWEVMEGVGGEGGRTWGGGGRRKLVLHARFFVLAIVCFLLLFLKRRSVPF